jgi:hypothetical protein
VTFWGAHASRVSASRTDSSHGELVAGFRRNELSWKFILARTGSTGQVRDGEDALPHQTQTGLGGGVGRVLGVGTGLGVGVARGVGVGVGVGVAVAVAVAMAVAVDVAVAVAVAVAVGVGEGVPQGCSV